jgi:V8-like Glu-specific endopeptidase
MVGTGFLIAGDLVLTVAHNIYSRSRGECFKDLVFYPGVSGELANILPIKIVGFRYPKQYEACLSKDTLDYDYALLKLERRVERPAFIQLGLDYAEQEEEILLSGYPGHSCNEDLAPQSFLWKAG